MKSILLLLSTFLYVLNTYSQGINGVISDENDKPLPYASIYVKEKGTGTSSNENGRYELRLPPGQYEITFQFIGYTAEVREVEVKEAFRSLDVNLKPQPEALQEVEVTASREDPAYTIMRKAIAKAPFHLLQLDGYSAEVYIKGSGGVRKIPGLFYNMLAKDGVDTNRVFTSESISEISFERPNTFKERVISVRTSGEDLSGASPNAYVNTSFYSPMVVDAVSPFSPQAMSYYRFRYIGNFVERGHKIHKIEVTPRSAGDKLFTGKLFVRDEYWNIHSLDLHTRMDFFELHLVQFFAPVAEEIWMPVTQKYHFSGSMMGFAGDYQYLASVSNYNISKNDELSAEVKLVDEDIEKTPSEIESIKKREVDKGIQEVFQENKEVSRKQFRKLLKAYEKQEEETDDRNTNILSDRTYEVDSSAAMKDSSFWAQRRPVPLTAEEEEGYHKDDSIYSASSTDSLKQPAYRTFSVSDAIFGGRYYNTGKWMFSTPGLLSRMRFNTVEGFNFDLNARLQYYTDTNVTLSFEPTIRYGLSSDVLYSSIAISRQSGPAEHVTDWSVEGGRFIQQFHPGSIHPLVNSLYSLFLERNYMKLYERDFIKLGFKRDFRYRFFFSASAEWASRSTLHNHSDYSFFDREGVEYQSNKPVSIEDPLMAFKNSPALKTAVEMRWRPWQKYRRYNGDLQPVANSSPEFRLTYKSGWDGLLESEVDFQQVELGLKTSFDLGVRAKFDVDIEAGSFLRNENMLFMDYKHFDGGLTELAPLSVTGNYRALDYYRYSTADAYISALSHIRFRKLLFTHLPIVRLTGVKESLFVNYLKTPVSPHYSELGYSIDNIFGIFRLELVQSFSGTNPERFGIRIGVGSLIKIGRRD